MKKVLITFFLYMSILGKVIAPPNSVISIPIYEPVFYISTISYEPLIDAMFMYEASKNPLAINEHEQAYGGLQIRQGLLDDYNKCNNTNYTLQDCLDFNITKKIFMYFTNHTKKGKKIPQKSWELTAKNWNGSGKKTEKYWENVKTIINKNS